jgi:MFS family permease
MEKFWDFRIKKGIELLPLFLNESFRGVAISLLSLFSSIFVYKILLSVTGQQKIALIAVVLYFLGTDVAKFSANIFAEKLSLRFGLKKQIYIGQTFLVLCLAFLFFSQQKPLLLIFAAILFGFSAGFYWFGRHSLMAKMGEQRDFGKELGIDGVIGTIISLSVPFLGGLLISLAGYRAMFLGALFFVLIAFVVLLRMPEEKIHHGTSLKEILALFFRHPRMFLAYFGNSAAGSIYAVIFPLYLFLILNKEVSLGEFFSLAMILSALINLFVGRWTDLKGKKELLGFGSISSALVWLGRFLTRTPPFLLILDVIDRLTGGLTGIPLNVLSYEKAVDGHSTGRAILFRETAISLGAILADLVLLEIVILGLNIGLSFFEAAILSLSPLLILKNEKIE